MNPPGSKMVVGWFRKGSPLLVEVEYDAHPEEEYLVDVLAARPINARTRRPMRPLRLTTEDQHELARAVASEGRAHAEAFEAEYHDGWED